VEAALRELRATTASGTPAIDADLDGKYGDPVVKWLPRAWTGQDFRGSPFSRCSPEFLDCLAAALDSLATRNDQAGALASNGKSRSTYNRLDAARARGWAQRNRAASAPTAKHDSPSVETDEQDDSPF